MERGCGYRPTGAPASAAPAGCVSARFFCHALKLAHRGYVMVNGLITLAGTGRELLERSDIKIIPGADRSKIKKHRIHGHPGRRVDSPEYTGRRQGVMRARR